MAESKNRCSVCGRNSDSMNNRRHECSHCDCPNRRKCWSEGRDEYLEVARLNSLRNEANVESLYDQMFDRTLD